MSDTLSIIAIVISATAAVYTMCFGVQPLKEYLLWLYYKMQWHSILGTLRYKWLDDRTISAAITNENIDDILIQVFKSIDFRHSHSEVNYLLLLHVLKTRSFKSNILLSLTNYGVFRFECICTVADTLNIESNIRAWQIVYEMTKLVNNLAPGGNKNAMNVLLNRIRGTLILLRANGNSASFNYAVMLHDALEMHLLEENSRNSDDTMNNAMATARSNIQCEERRM